MSHWLDGCRFGSRLGENSIIQPQVETLGFNLGPQRFLDTVFGRTMVRPVDIQHPSDFVRMPVKDSGRCIFAGKQSLLSLCRDDLHGQLTQFHRDFAFKSDPTPDGNPLVFSVS